MATIPERVSILETKIEYLPAMQNDLETLKSRDDRARGRNDVLKALAALAAGSGILSFIANLIMLMQRSR